MASITHCSSISKHPKELINSWFTIPFIGALVITLIYDFNNLKSQEYGVFVQSWSVSYAFWTVLANGNSIIIYLIDKRWTWLDHPYRRAAIGITSILIYTPIASLLIIYCFVEFVLDVRFQIVLENKSIFSLLMVPMGITILVALWGHGRVFFIEWRQAAIDVERLKNENLKSKFETLKTQVNPHFLFNSLNALTSLVYADQSKAVEFIQKLSQVYRYVLDHQNDEVVPLQTEVDFLKSFVYLNTIRFGDNFEVVYKNMDTFLVNENIPPVTLQMLIENCIKHNEISKKNQLKITVERKDDRISVDNNINLITSAKQDSSGLGLSNIISRYEMLSDQKVEVIHSKDSFEVIVPILSLES
ncbi:Histidine kinase [Reichenbachiella faecimaris]|uniref:Histidine kinase n=1 Tax=Reichenbachiella faecimaris TaxID=692418 RepID=A0A1W2GN77_REIFA|nr:histidine kinase [Reichenbachiella faecimaris]SMD38115.1 Histidine kinase [Reichenbachiella faecimaris]